MTLVSAPACSADALFVFVSVVGFELHAAVGNMLPAGSTIGLRSPDRSLRKPPLVDLGFSGIRLVTIDRLMVGRLGVLREAPPTLAPKLICAALTR